MLRCVWETRTCITPTKSCHDCKVYNNLPGHAKTLDDHECAYVPTIECAHPEMVCLHCRVYQHIPQEERKRMKEDSNRREIGLSSDAPVTVNEHGASESVITGRYDLLDPEAIRLLSIVLAEGAKKYGAWNWKKLSVSTNLNHALMHIFAYLEGDTQDEHLSHAFARLMFAIGSEEQNTQEMED